MMYYFLHFAITAWPFLNFYGSETNHKLVSIPSFSCLFLIFWVGGLLTCALLKKVLQTTSERIFVAYAFFIVSFFSFERYKPIALGIHLPKPSYVFVCIVLLTVFLAYKFSKYSAFQKATQLFVFVVFSFSVLENIFISLKQERVSALLVDQQNGLSYVFKERPNIYFLLLDTYAGSNALKSKIKFDNTEFVNFFKNKGFVVAENAHSNYSHTTPSLSATLQMNYLIKEEVNENDVFSTDKTVLKILKENNYKFVSIPAYFDFLVPRNTADVIITPNSSLIFSLTNVNFLQTTIFDILIRLIRPFLYFGNDEIMKIFQIPGKESKFVFIHYLQLHDFAYGKDCKISPHLTLNRATVEEFHTNLSCINGFAEETIDKIMTHDPNSIIIVQGDHGPSWWRAGEHINSLERFELIFSIFSAVYIPGLEKNSPIAKYLATSPSPVNNFRIIFSYLAKEPVELLPDRYYLKPYREVTDQVHSFKNEDIGLHLGVDHR